MADFTKENFRRLAGFAVLLVLVLIAFFSVKTISEIKRFSYIGNDFSSNSISVSGEGEVFAVADIASFTYSVVESGSTVSEAEAAATERWNGVLAYLEGEGVSEADIRTTNYSVDPQYAPLPPNTAYIPLVERNITGYTVTQTARVKIRDTEKVGDILSTVGDQGVRNLSGISFTIDDESALKAQARAEAIADAKDKAEVLARSLGVRLDGVMSYYEMDGGYYPYAVEESRMMAMDSAGSVAQSSPTIPMGENRILVNVEVVYRIR